MRTKKSRLTLFILALVPLILFGVVSERNSWRPKVIFQAKGARPLGFSPNGHFLLTCSNNQVQLWNWRRGAVLRHLNRTPAEWGAVDNDGRIYILSAMSLMGYHAPGADGKFRVWNGLNGQLLKTYDSPGYSLIIAPDCKKINISSGSEDEASIETYEARTGRKLRDYKVVVPPNLKFEPVDTSASGGCGPVSCPGPPISPDGRWLITTLWNVTYPQNVGVKNEFKGWCLFDTVHKTKRLIKNFYVDANHPQYAVSGFSSNSKMLLFASQYYIEIWDAETLTMISRSHITDKNAVYSLQNNSSLLAGMNESGKILHIWDMLTGKLERELKHPHAVFNFCLSPDGKTLVTGDEVGVIRTWRLK